MQRDTVKCQNGLDKIVKPNGFYQCGTMVVDYGFSAFCNLLT